tara:strand:+ start:1224 stop:4199 length:2976 start_codon:yes stop_codon:yes gene_type:complete
MTQDRNFTINNFLENDFNLPSEKLKHLNNSLKRIVLEPGEKLNDFKKPVPGLFLIKEGKLRLLALDEKKDLFTIKIFTEGEVVGANELMRGVFEESFSASSVVKGILLPSHEFLKLIHENKDIAQFFSGLEINEIYSSFSACNEFNKDFNSKNILTLAKDTFLKSAKVINLEPGEHLLQNIPGEMIISSCNFKNLSSGSLIKAPLKVHITGKLPGRVISLPSDFLKNLSEVDFLKNNKKIFKDKKDNGDYEEIRKIQDQLQFEALEDWYGRLNSSKSYPFSKGSGPLYESLACLRMLSQHFDLPFRKDLVRSVIQDQLNLTNSGKLKIQQFAAICELIGLRTSLLKANSLNLHRIPLPALTFRDNHPIILWEKRKEKIYISDPLKGLKFESINNILDSDSVDILYFERCANSPKARFGLSWFLPSIIKHRNSLIQVVIASFFAQLLGLFNPLLIQQIIDAVISQGNLASLNVLGFILILMAIAQALISSLRTFLFADTTNRIDISLGASIIHHLLRLPLNYFSRRPVGEVSNRISELEKIRSFLTGTALSVILDSIFSVIYIAVMLAYSVRLTFFSLAVIPLFIILSFIISPLIRKHLRKQAIANARVNSHLVEILSGIETVKGQGMELQSEWRWEKFYSEQIHAGFQNIITSTSAGAISNFLQQASGLIVIWAGAIIVLSGEMSLGQLIAFRILSGYVTGPLLRMATLWQNFQETIISLERLSDIVDHKEEIEIAGLNLPPLPPIKGHIKYEKIYFRFSENGPNQLSNISFTISPGCFIGIVGSSGSGKSTLLKLLTRLFDPNQGTISIDGNNIKKFDLHSLRSQVGVVPQDTLLFEGSIKENIASARPEANIEDIRKASEIACAHSFIKTLPAGYNTMVGEKGANLSGGQRQRIAIARMVLKEPKLLILDEATSSLDLDTERQLISQIAEAFKEKTVLFITHRISSLEKADQILVLHKGALVEEGKHKDLIALKGRYSSLYKQQDYLNT